MNGNIDGIKKRLFKNISHLLLIFVKINLNNMDINKKILDLMYHSVISEGYKDESINGTHDGVLAKKVG